MKRMKKGFTIVELVIVIAVIAVLSAVLIPTFIHLSKKAKETNDKSIVKNANIQLAAQEGVQGKNRSMREAVRDVDEIGYHMSTVHLSGDNYIVWDSTSDRFVLFSSDHEVLQSDAPVSEDCSKLFYAVSSPEDARLTDRGFGIYAKSDYTGFEFESGVSFDTGDLDEEDDELFVEGLSISYSLGATDASVVHVATKSTRTKLTVSAPAADFSHSGLCGEVLINAVADDTFNEFGKVGFVEVVKGHFVADQGANVKAVYASSGDAKVDIQNGGVIVKAYGGGEDYSNDHSKGNVTLEYNTAKDTIKQDAISELEHELNPGAIEVTQSNYSSIFTKDGTYKLTEDIAHTVAPFVIPEGLIVTLDLNGHNISCGYTQSEFDLLYEQACNDGNDDEFMVNASTITVFGNLTVVGSGEIGGPGGWFGIYNLGTVTLGSGDGDSIVVKGGKVWFEYGFYVFFSAIAGDVTAEGYVYSGSNHNVYSRP